MKTWTMPSVEIEGFVANEYVSSCQSDNYNAAKAWYNRLSTWACDLSDSNGLSLTGSDAYAVIYDLNADDQADINSGDYVATTAWVKVVDDNWPWANEHSIQHKAVSGDPYRRWYQVYVFKTSTHALSGDTYFITGGSSIPATFS